MHSGIAFVTTLALIGFVPSISKAAEPWKEFSSPPVNFSYPPSWKAPTSKSVKAEPLENPQDKPDGVAPAHIEITIEPAKIQIYAFPLTEAKEAGDKFAKKYPTVDSAAKDLKKLLAKPVAAKSKDTPFLPWADATTYFESQKKQVAFKNGKAISFLAEYLIEPDVIDNARLIYTAQGVSSDGKYYLSVVSPVKTKSLPEKGDVSKMTPDAYKKFSATFSAYATKVGAKLDRLLPASFEPDLADLDKLVKSIELK
jgi:hypothetical protein